MKTRKSSSTLIIMLTLSSICTSLFAQSGNAWTDSIVTYNFTGLEDSVRAGIQIFQRTDSSFRYEHEWKGLWNTDSGKWIADSEYRRAWDQQENEILYTWSRWEGVNGWVPWDSVWRDWDANSNILFMDVYKWNSNMQDWAGERRSEYFRDNAGNDTLRHHSVWDWNTNYWRYNSRYRNSFDQDNRIIETLYYEWMPFEEYWKFVSGERYEYTLNEAGLVLSRLSQGSDFVDTTWHTTFKVEYTYNDAGLTLRKEQFRMAGEVWEQTARQDWAFDDAGNEIQNIIYEWDFEGDSMVYSRRIDKAYDNEGRNTLFERLLWDTEQQDWLLFRRYTYEYFSGDLFSSRKEESWVIPGDGAYYSSLDEFLYNDAGKDSVRIHSTWNEGLQDFELLWKKFYFYDEIEEQDPNGIHELQPQVFTIYPNPARNHVFIESELPVGRVDILDLNGRVVLSSARVEAGVDLSSLGSGIYLVRLRDQEGRLLGTQKIVKE